MGYSFQLIARKRLTNIEMIGNKTNNNINIYCECVPFISVIAGCNGFMIGHMCCGIAGGIITGNIAFGTVMITQIAIDHGINTASATVHMGL